MSDYILMIIFGLFWAVICFLTHFFIDDEGFFLLSGEIFLFFVAYLCIYLLC